MRHGRIIDLRDRHVGDWASYTRSFIRITDARIAARVDSELSAGAFWPEPLLQLNPTFLPGGTIDELAVDKKLQFESPRTIRYDKLGTWTL